VLPNDKITLGDYNRYCNLFCFYFLVCWRKCPSSNYWCSVLGGALFDVKCEIGIVTVSCSVVMVVLKLKNHHKK
jgi:hypothetical protein